MIIRKKKCRNIPIVLFSILMFLGFLSAAINSYGYTITELSTVDWYVTYGSDDLDQGWDCAIDSLGNAYLIGTTSLNGISDNATLVKYDSSGTLDWERHWGGSFNDNGEGACIDSANNAYLVGQTHSLGSDQIYGDCFVAKYNTEGTLIWNRTWGTAGTDMAKDVIVDSDFNVYIVGFSDNGANGWDNLYLKYNSSGDLQFALLWGGINSEVGYGIEQTTTGNIVLSGQTGSFGAGNTDIFVLYYTTAGTLIWNTTWGSSTLDRGYDVAVDSGDNIYVGGWTYYPDDLMAGPGIYNINFVLVKFDSTGKTLWSRIWGRENMDYGIGVDIDSEDNIYYVGDGTIDGWGVRNMYIGKFASSGALLSETLWGGGVSEVGHAITINKATNDIYVVGDSNSFNLDHNYDLVMIKNPTFPSTDTQNPISNSIPTFNIILIISIISACVIAIITRKHRN
ncbi:MAG: hypothetical protein ACFE9Z_03580 [Promethearchaeota archaeon]